jgi:hypothetical protein
MSDLKVFTHISQPAQISVTDFEICMKRLKNPTLGKVKDFSIIASEIQTKSVSVEMYASTS